MTIMSAEALEKMKNMASVRMYKMHGQFNNRVFSTCPAFPKFHSTHGEPIVTESTSAEYENNRKTNTGSISKNSLKMLGRIDFIEINEETEEVYVKDDCGIYILFDCSLQDMKTLEDDLIRTGSYFIQQEEVLVDTTTERPYPQKDRLDILQDLVLMEASFQYNKVKLVQCYMECYEHICDPLE